MRETLVEGATPWLLLLESWLRSCFSWLLVSTHVTAFDVVELALGSWKLR